jgi:D-2-hydroxyacid dehydrogenase (NADP+)
MEPVNVVVTDALRNEGCLELIQKVSPRIKLVDASKVVAAEKKGDKASQKKLDSILAEAEVVFGFWLPENIINRIPKAKWVQVMSAGVDKFLDDQWRRSPVMLTSVSGIHATAISEFVLGLILIFVKRSLHSVDLQRERKWERFAPGILHSKTVGIIGLGHIGREVARLAKAFGMKVIATRRSTRQVARARNVDVLLPQAQLSELLAESDFVVLSLPLTPETRKYIGQREFKAMKPSAYFINIARGEIVDEVALTRALEEHWIAGAGLDVFAAEPLSADSKLWALPQVLISPHVAGAMEDYDMRATLLFCENLKRYLAGKKLINLVNKNKGY